MEQLTLGSVVQPKNYGSKQYIVIEVMKNSVKCINIDSINIYSNRVYLFNKNIIKIIRQLNKQELEILNSKVKLLKTPSNLKIRR